MKNIILILPLFIGFTLHSQVSVTTLTPEIKGSGGLSLDEDQNLYIADFGDFLSTGDGDGIPNKILKLDENLNLTEYASDFVKASGNAFDNNGVLFQSDIATSEIFKIVDGNKVFVTSTGIAGPVGLTFDSNNNLYVCNCGSNSIRKVTPGGTSTSFVSGSVLNCPNGLTIDENDNLYVSNFGNGDIIKIDPSGTPAVLNSTPGGTTSGPSNGHIDYHEGSKTLFVSSVGSNQIFYLSINNPSNMQVLAGSGLRGNDDGDALSATFSKPNGLAVTQTGDSIYVNCAIPLTNDPNNPLNPQVIRLITGVSIVTSIPDKDRLQSKISVYPNPFYKTFTIEANLLDNYNNLTIKVFDISGKLVYEMGDLASNDNRLISTIDFLKKPSGLYFFQIVQETSVLFNGELIKR